MSNQRVSSDEIQSEALVNRLRRSTSEPSQYQERRGLLQDECQNMAKPSLDTMQNDGLLNYLGFVLRSQSLFYCSVPKVATRTLLTYLTYLHIRDELIPSLKTASIPFDINYFYTMFAKEYKVWIYFLTHG